MIKITLAFFNIAVLAACSEAVEVQSEPEDTTKKSHLRIASSYVPHNGDAARGEDVFKKNCAACHSGGGNVIFADKTLFKGDLERNNMYDKSAIERQVINGKGPMPAFGGRQSDQDTADVAKYVLEMADSGWGADEITNVA